MSLADFLARMNADFARIFGASEATLLGDYRASLRAAYEAEARAAKRRIRRATLGSCECGEALRGHPFPAASDPPEPFQKRADR